MENITCDETYIIVYVRKNKSIQYPRERDTSHKKGFTFYSTRAPEMPPSLCNFNFARFIITVALVTLADFL